MSKDRLPAGWARVALSEIAGPTRPRVDPQSIPDAQFVGMEHIEAHTMRLLGTVPARMMRSVGVRFEEGDVLYGRLRPYLNKVHHAAMSGLCSAEFIVLSGGAVLDARFLAYRLNAADFVDFAAHLNEGDRPRVDFGQIGAFELMLPPVAEQGRIVAALEEHLSDLNAAVAGLERARANLTRWRAAVLLAAVRAPDGADESGNPEGLWRLPTNWVWSTVGNVGDVLLGRQRAPQYLTGRFSRPYLRVANVGDDVLRLDDVKTMDFDDEHFAKYRLEPGDVLVSEGQSPELVGQSAIYRGEIPDACFQKTLHRFRAHRERVLPEYAQLVFRSFVKGGVFQRFASLTVNIAHLTLERFRNVPFPLPPIDAQRTIVENMQRQLALADRTAADLDLQLARAARLRQSILQRAFSGHLVPQNLAEEPAESLLERLRAQKASRPRSPSRKARAGA